MSIITLLGFFLLGGPTETRVPDWVGTSTIRERLYIYEGAHPSFVYEQSKTPFREGPAELLVRLPATWWSAKFPASPRVNSASRRPYKSRPS